MPFSYEPVMFSLLASRVFKGQVKDTVRRYSERYSETKYYLRLEILHAARTSDKNTRTFRAWDIL